MSEVADSLFNTSFASTLDLISEGPIGGLVNGLQSIFLNNVPVQNADNTTNFPSFTWDHREGTLTQSYIPGQPSVENAITVNQELRGGIPYVYSPTNLALSAVRITLSVPQILQQNTTTGDITGYSIAYIIEVSTDGGAFATVVNTAITGKQTSKYARSHRIDLPKATIGWTVRVTRTTPNLNIATTSDTMNVDTVSEVIDAKLKYPWSALMWTQFDAASFSGSIPTRAFDMYGRVLSVPSNYDPVARTYTGIWDGTFKQAFTDSPAWVFYDIVTNTIYGLGRFVNRTMIDPYALYSIAQYCDQLVPDGKGGQEPRYTCNVYIQSQNDATKVLQDLASVFRGMAYWGGSIENPTAQLVAISDSPADPVYTFSKANIIGDFQYAGSTKDTRYTAALVSWNDPQDFYVAKNEYVDDAPGIARYGFNQTTITAFGCTSQGQAQRVGRALIETSLAETDVLTFDVGLDEMVVSPGDVVRIADPIRAGRRIGGRVSSVNATDTRIVTLDKADPNFAVGDSLLVNLPDASTQSNVVTAIAGNQITVRDAWRFTPVAQTGWGWDSPTLFTQTFKILTIKDKDDISFTITASAHEPQKFANIDNGTRIDSRPVTALNPRVQAAPASCVVSSYAVIVQGVASINGVISWDAAPGAVYYIPEWRRDNGDWIVMPQTSSTQSEILGAYSGTYLARVRAYSSYDVPSVYTTSALTPLTGNMLTPPVVSSFTASTDVIQAINLLWGFPTGAYAFDHVEVRYSLTTAFSAAISLGSFPYPANTASLIGLESGASLFFWIRIVDKNGTPGPWFPSETGAGINGQASSDATAILTYLAGQIGKLQLAQDLESEIDNTASLAASTQQLAAQTSSDMAALYVQFGVVQQEVATQSGIIARYDPPMAGDPVIKAGNVTTLAGVYSEQYARASADLALATNLDVTAASIGNQSALIQIETNARVTGDSALASQVTTVQTNLTNAVGTLNSSITNEATARANADGAFATQMTTVQATVTTNYNTLSASITSESTARANGDSANATAINTVQANVNNVSASAQTNATAIANLNGSASSSYTIKVQIASNGQYYAAGMAVGIDNSTGVAQSTILFRADLFALINPANNANTTPFVIQGGSTYINQAFIGTGWITNLMIGDLIQSTAVGSNGLPRWSLNKNGTLQINGVSAGSGYLTLSDSSLLVYDGAGTLRVRVGIW
jgi:predicted phage tail protein